MNIELYQKIEEAVKTNGTVNVVIAGITCSGKTTLAKKIKEDFSDKYTVTIVSQDDYYKNFPDIPRTDKGVLVDSIEAFETEEFQNDVKKLIEDGVVIMPRYDVATNSRVSKNKIVRRGQINVFEGLHTITLLKYIKDSIIIYMDADIDVCLLRRIKRDTAAFGILETRVREFWNDCIIPMCKQFIFPQKAFADIIDTGGTK